MALFKGTPTYFGEGAVACQRRDRGLADWFARLLGFPKTPCYQPAGPVAAEEPSEPPFAYAQAPCRPTNTP